MNTAELEQSAAFHTWIEPAQPVRIKKVITARSFELRGGNTAYWPYLPTTAALPITYLARSQVPI
jgi:hypothetical protein